MELSDGVTLSSRPVLGVFEEVPVGLALALAGTGALGEVEAGAGASFFLLREEADAEADVEAASYAPLVYTGGLKN